MDLWTIIATAERRLAAGQIGDARAGLQEALRERPKWNDPPPMKDGHGWVVIDQRGHDAWAEDAKRFRDGGPSPERWAVFHWNGTWWGRTTEEDHLTEAQARAIYTARVHRGAH